MSSTMSDTNIVVPDKSVSQNMDSDSSLEPGEVKTPPHCNDDKLKGLLEQSATLLVGQHPHQGTMGKIDGSLGKDSTSETNCPPTTTNAKNSAVDNNEIKSLTTTSKPLKTPSQLETKMCEEKIRAILELDAKKRKEEIEKRKEELERRRQSGELAAEEEMKKNAKKQRKLERKLEKQAKKANTNIDGDAETDRDSMSSNRTLDGGKIKRGHKEKDVERSENDIDDCDNDTIYSNNRYIYKKRNPMLTTMVDGLLPEPMDRLHYQVVHPHMGGVPAYACRPNAPFKHGKQRYNYGYGEVNFWLRGGRGRSGGYCRFPNYRPSYHPRGNRFYIARGNMSNYKKFPIMRGGHSTQISSDTHLLWTKCKPPISYTFNLQPHGEEKTVEISTSSLNETDKKAIHKDEKEAEVRSKTKHKSKHKSKKHQKKGKLKIKKKHSVVEDNSNLNICNKDEEVKLTNKKATKRKLKYINGVTLVQDCSDNNTLGGTPKLNNAYESDSNKEDHLKENDNAEFTKKELLVDISLKLMNQNDSEVSSPILCSKPKSDAHSDEVDVFKVGVENEKAEEKDTILQLDIYCNDSIANNSDKSKLFFKDGEKQIQLEKSHSDSCLVKAPSHKLTSKTSATNILEVQQRIDKMLGDTDFDINNIEEMKKTLIEKSQKHRSAKQSLRQRQVNSDDEENEPLSNEQNKAEHTIKTIKSELIDQNSSLDIKGSVNKNNSNNEKVLHYKVKNLKSVNILTEHDEFENEMEFTKQSSSNNKSKKDLFDDNNGKNKHNEIKSSEETDNHLSLGHHKDFQLNDFKGQKRKSNEKISITPEKIENSLYLSNKRKYRNNNGSKIGMDKKSSKKEFKSKNKCPVWAIGKPISFAASEFLFPEENDTSTDDDKKEIYLNPDDNTIIQKDELSDNNSKKLMVVDSNDSESCTKDNESPNTDDYMDNWENDDIDVDYQQKYKSIETVSPLSTGRMLDRFETLHSFINPSPPGNLLENQVENLFLQCDNDNKSDRKSLARNLRPNVSKKFVNGDFTKNESCIDMELFEMQDVYDQFVKNIEASGVELKSDEEFLEMKNISNIDNVTTITNAKGYNVFDLQGPTENLTNQVLSKLRTSISFSLKPSSKLKNTSCLSVSSHSSQSSPTASPVSTTPSTPPPSSIALSLKLSSNNKLSPSAFITAAAISSQKQKNNISLEYLTKDENQLTFNSTAQSHFDDNEKLSTISLYSPNSTKKPPSKQSSPLPDASKDFKKLKNLESNLNRIQMLRANYGSSDDLSDELRKIEMLLLKEKKLVLQKYTKSSSLSPASPKSGSNLNNKNVSSVDDKISKSLDLELKIDKNENLGNDFSIISLSTLQQEEVDLGSQDHKHEDDTFSKNKTSLPNKRSNDEVGVSYSSSSKTKDSSKYKERKQRERDSERKREYRDHERKREDYDHERKRDDYDHDDERKRDDYDHDHERKHDDYDYDHERIRDDYDYDIDNDQERSRDYEHNYNYERERDHDCERDNDYENNRFYKSHYSSNYRRHENENDTNRLSLKDYRSSLSKARIRMRSRSQTRSISSGSSPYYKNRRYSYNLNKNNIYHKNKFGSGRYGRSYVPYTPKWPPLPKWKRYIKRPRSPRLSRSPQSRKHFYSPNNRDSRSPLPFKPPSPPMSPKSHNSDSSTQSPQRRPRSPHSPRLSPSSSCSSRSPRFLHSAIPLRYNSHRRPNQRSIASENFIGDNRYQRESSMPPSTFTDKYRNEPHNRGDIDKNVKLTSNYYNNQPFDDPSSTEANNLYNNINYSREYENTEFTNLEPSTSSYYPSPYIPPGTCDSVYSYINNNVNHTSANGLPIRQQLEQHDQFQQVPTSHFSTNLLNLKSTNPNLDSVNVLSHSTQQQYSSMTNDSNSSIYDNNPNANSAVMLKDIHKMPSTAVKMVNVMPQFAKEAIKATGVAVQKGNVLEIVPSTDSIIQKGSNNIHVKIAKPTQFKLNSQVEYPPIKRFKNNIEIMGNMNCSNTNINVVNTQIINDDYDMQCKKLRSILKGNDNHITQMPQIIKTKKRVKFSDGIKANCDSEDEDRAATIESVRRKLLRLRKKYGVDLPLLYELPDIGVNGASKIDPTLANLPPPPPPPNEPPPHLPQPIYLKPPTPVPLLYFRYDNVVGSMYISPLKEAIPPRKFNPKCVPSTATSTLATSSMTPCLQQQTNHSIYKRNGHINMNALHTNVPPPLRYGSFPAPVNVGSMVPVANAVGLQQTVHQPMRRFDKVYSHPPPPPGHLMPDDVIGKKNITMGSDRLNSLNRHLLPLQTMIPPPIINQQRLNYGNMACISDGTLAPAGGASYGQLPLNRISKNNVNILPNMGGYRENFRHFPLPPVTPTATITPSRIISQNVLPVTLPLPLSSPSNAIYHQPILNYPPQRPGLTADTTINLQRPSVQNV